MDIHAPPSSCSDAETWVLGSVLLKPDVISDCRLDPSDFIDSTAAAVYRAIQSLVDQGKPIDIKLIAHDLRDHDGISAVELAELLRQMPTAIHAGYYADIVREWSARRWAWRIGQALIKSAHDSRGDVVAECQDAIDGLSRHVIERMEGRR